jgi:hypothetical protein
MFEEILGMTFEAYITNIRAKTGKGPKEFFDEAVQLGVLNAETRTMEFVAWLKTNSGLGHGHAMAIWEAFKRNGWVPLSGSGVGATQRRSRR